MRPPPLYFLEQARSMHMEVLLLSARAVVVAVNSMLFLLLVDRQAVMYELAVAIMALAAVYALSVLALKPILFWRRLYASAWVTTVVDSVFIILWVFATGGFESQFYLLFYLGVAAIAIRFSLPESLIAAAVFSVSYVGLAFLTVPSLENALFPLSTRVAYIWFIAFVVGKLAREERIRTRELAEFYRLNEENLRLREQAEQLAMVDGLTGLTSRRYGLELLAREVARSVRTGQPVYLLFCDLDAFKEVNDRLGHPRGDQVLQAFAQLLRGVFRRSMDVLVRYGGDEFLVILPSSQAASAKKLADVLVEQTRATLTPPELRHAVNIGVSIGIAAAPGDAQHPAELIMRADEAMYWAKSHGGRRVVFYTEASEQN